jgi:hypothetical protein
VWWIVLTRTKPSSAGGISFNDYETCADNAISNAISDEIRESVILVRYAVPCKSCSYERKRHRRIRTADTKSKRQSVEPRIETL